MLRVLRNGLSQRQKHICDSRVPSRFTQVRNFLYDQELMKQGPCVPDLSEEVVWEDPGQIRVCYLNRPKALNALSINMIDRVRELFTQYERAPHIHAVVLRGTTDGKAFCAGGDVRKVVLDAQSEQFKSDAARFFRTEYQMNFQISRMHTPVISILDGVTMGGGVGISLYGWFRVATENTVIAMPECNIGLFPDVGTISFLQALPDELGTMLALTGFRLRGRDVESIGIATHFMGSYKIKKLERRLNTVAPYSLAHTGHETIDNALTDHDELEDVNDEGEEIPCEDSILLYSSSIAKAFSGDSVEGILSQLDQQLKQLEEEGFEPAPLVEMKEAMMKACPLSLKVTLARLRRAAGNHNLLSDHLKLDYRMAQHFINNPNFHEGVRARLIDKCGAPKWTPATLEEVTPEMVEEFFKPAAEELELPEALLKEEAEEHRHIMSKM